jgi:hypothetical protein
MTYLHVIHGKQVNVQPIGHAEGFTNLLSTGGVLALFWHRCYGLCNDCSSMNLFTSWDRMIPKAQVELSALSTRMRRVSFPGLAKPL